MQTKQSEVHCVYYMAYTSIYKNSLIKKRIHILIQSPKETNYAPHTQARMLHYKIPPGK